MKIILTSRLTRRKSCSKKLSKYATTFGYIDKILIVLNAASVGDFIITSAEIVRAPVGIASFNLIFFLTAGIMKNLLGIIRNKKKKHDKILTLAKEY